jgi:hypothetical protein
MFPSTHNAVNRFKVYNLILLEGKFSKLAKSEEFYLLVYNAISPSKVNKTFQRNMPLLSAG